MSRKYHFFPKIIINKILLQNALFWYIMIIINGGNMEAWSTVSPNSVRLIEKESAPLDKGFCKVRITTAAISGNDLDIVKGRYKINYPLILGRSAIGVIAETDEDSPFKKGDRVVVSPFMPCLNCINCREGKLDECLDFSYRGVNYDGLLRDFVTLPVENVFALPDSVSDEDGVFIGTIANALTILDRIKFEKGSFIGIGSAGVLGNIIAQLCLYYQAIPVVFDNSQELLDSSKDAGIYYNFLSDDKAKKKVLQVTGGKMLDSLIYLREQALNLSDCFSYLKQAGELFVASIATVNSADVSVPLISILEKDIKITPVPYQNDNFMTAINLLVNNSVNVKSLISGEIPFSDVGDLFANANETEDFPFMVKLVRL